VVCCDGVDVGFAKLMVGTIQQTIDEAKHSLAKMVIVASKFFCGPVGKVREQFSSDGEEGRR
jgi:ribosomal protein L30E